MAENVETLNNIIEFTYFFLIREIIVLLYCSNEASMQHYSGWLMADSMHIKRIWQTGRARHYTNMTIRRSFPCKQCWVRSSEGHWLCKCVLRQNKILNIKYRWNVCVCKVSVIAVFGLANCDSALFGLNRNMFPQKLKLSFDDFLVIWLSPFDRSQSQPAWFPPGIVQTFPNLPKICSICRHTEWANESEVGAGR